MDELFKEKIILKKISEFNLFEELINSEINPIINLDSFPFFFSCRKCNIVPKITFMDNCQIIFRCSKCHIFESEKINNLRKFNSKWIKSFDNKAPPVRNLSEFYEVLDIYNELLLKKVKYIKENINYIQYFKNIMKLYQIF